MTYCLLQKRIYYSYITYITHPKLNKVIWSFFSYITYLKLKFTEHMVILFSFIFKSPNLHKYPSALSFSNSSKFLILQFLVKCYKLHSAFKVLLKSHMLDIFLISSVYFKCSYKLSFHSFKEFK